VKEKISILWQIWKDSPRDSKWSYIVLGITAVAIIFDTIFSSPPLSFYLPW